VPAKLAARARLLGTSSARKSDLADACSVAAAALHTGGCARSPSRTTPSSSGCSATAATTWSPSAPAPLGRLHVLLAGLHPGGAARERSATRAAGLLRQVRPITLVDLQRKRIARQLLADVRRLDRQVKAASQAIRTAVREHGSTLTQVHGVGPVLAAKLVGHAGDIARFPDRDHFASYTGTAPIEASSGDVRHIG
jgi:transposase